MVPPSVRSVSRRAVILDMDGLMIDTERIAVECWIESAHRSGWEISRETCLAMVGMDDRASRVRLLQAEGGHAGDGHSGTGGPFPLEEISARARVRYRQRLNDEGIGLKPGIIELLDWLDASGIPKAVATSTIAEMAQEKLVLSGLRNRFHTIVCGDQVAKTKPAPDIYLEAAAQLGQTASACIALEDSDVGLRAAHAAGLACIVVPDLQPLRPQYAGLAHTIVRNLDEAQTVVQQLLGR